MSLDHLMGYWLETRTISSIGAAINNKLLSVKKNRERKIQSAS